MSILFDVMRGSCLLEDRTNITACTVETYSQTRILIVYIRASPTMGCEPKVVAKCSFGVAKQMVWQITYRSFCILC